MLFFDEFRADDPQDPWESLPPDADEMLEDWEKDWIDLGGEG
jgi:hypothetical protein